MRKHPEGQQEKIRVRLTLSSEITLRGKHGTHDCVSQRTLPIMKVGCLRSEMRKEHGKIRMRLAPYSPPPSTHPSPLPPTRNRRVSRSHRVIRALLLVTSAFAVFCLPWAFLCTWYLFDQHKNVGEKKRDEEDAFRYKVRLS